MTPDIETAEFRRQLQQLLRHRNLIVACTVLGTVTALVVSFTISRTYAADAALSISRSKIGEGQMAADPLSTADVRPLIESRGGRARGTSPRVYTTENPEGPLI